MFTRASLAAVVVLANLTAVGLAQTPASRRPPFQQQQSRIAALEKQVAELQAKLDKLTADVNMIRPGGPREKPAGAAAPKTIAEPKAGTLTLPTSGTVTTAKYERVVEGMTYFDAAKIIGFWGKELSRSSMPGIEGVGGVVTVVMYGWQNDDGSNMNAMFQNDRLTIKAQAMLK